MITYENNLHKCLLKDLKRLHDMLNNVLDVYRVPFAKFNHLDFLWGKDAPQLVYKRLLHIIKKSYFNEQKNT